MEKLNLITENYRHTFIYVAQYLKNISNNVYALWEAIVGKNMAYFINQYLRQNYRFYIGIGGFLGFVWVLKYFFKNDPNKTNSISSGSSLSKLSSNSKRLQNQKVKNKLKNIKFLSETQENDLDIVSQNMIKNDSTCSSKGGRKSSQKAKNQKKDKYDQMDHRLESQMKKVKTYRIVLQDSMSDKIFNQVYGVYMET